MSDFQFVVCVPARYASSRLPGKPLIKLKGKELILWAVESAQSLGASQVVVATDDARIESLVAGAGHQVVMTSATHQSGTDRIAECAHLMGWSDDTWVLNYQGDEPQIPVDNVRQVIDMVQQHPEASIGTLYQEITRIEQVMDPNCVKLVTDHTGRALYFSRAPIPYSQATFGEPPSMPPETSYKHHIGLYMYKVSFLKKFAALPPSEMELLESLEQLRALAHGEVIVAARATQVMPRGIDTAEDVAAFERQAD
ncbi:3-deoxy-manno-octulosonate cytidylyltransferase [Marinicella sediminis]|uniref:3-deoxy-manno-octulosonate cytidylyltransferase n=1 Tax=Marinicella sediminis TaxID=1792834 RepID=A0ABV7JC05_9GAMM|nr:3-deoxy-manno-octulosonate cytidylyltransferase [Marinicella sediminis]